MLYSEEIFKEVTFECREFRKMWTLKKVEDEIRNGLECNIITDVHVNENEAYFPYGFCGSFVSISTDGLKSWDQERIIRIAKTVEDISMCELDVYSLGSRRILIHQTPPREELYLLYPEELKEMLDKSKEEWFRNGN